MSGEDLKFAAVAFSAIFFVVDPIISVPVFLAITSRDSSVKKREMAARASLACFVLLTLFALGGSLLFKIFGISIGGFRVAGGAMLFLMAVDMIRANPSPQRTTEEEQEESSHKDDVAIVPMAMPMLCGPGAIATVIMLMSKAAWKPVQTVAVFLSIAITSLVCWLCLRASTWSQRFLSKTVTRVIERVMGLLLAAIAIEFIAGGLRDLFPVIGKA